MTAAPGMRVAGDTNVGMLRTTNEDSLIVDPVHNLYAVFDGMGGANAGDIASQMARDVIREFVAQHHHSLHPRALLESAIQAGTAAVWNAAQSNRERHGMGTTVVACLVIDPGHVVIGHVGDSRAYVLRGGRLQALTRDHTIVEELVDRGLLSLEEADRHPYKNVLSRNLGARPETRIDLIELELQPGDRLLLCSDGLYGYAAAEAIQYVLGSGDAPDHVARDLIDLALRGGGGDNVSTIVIEAPPAMPSSTEVVRTTGAAAWWNKRQRFLVIAKDRGLTRNPIVRGLEPNEALEVVALSLCQAVFHDLEKSTGVNVWTFAQQLGGGWFERGGEWAPLRAIIDILGTSARVCVDEVRAEDAQLGFLLDVAVSRALIVAELALGGLLADRLRQVDADLIGLHATQRATLHGLGVVEPGEAPAETGERWIDRETIPFLRPDRSITNSGVSGDILAAIGKTIVLALARTSPRASVVKQALTALETIAHDASANFATAVQAARELYGVRTLDEAGIAPLFEALDTARIAIASSVRQIQATEHVRAKVLLALSAAHQRLVSATTGLVLESVAPFSERLREVQVVTHELRDQVASGERRRAALERTQTTTLDQSLPWGSRGTTEW